MYICICTYTERHIYIYILYIYVKIDISVSISILHYYISNYLFVYLYIYMYGYIYKYIILYWWISYVSIGFAINGITWARFCLKKMWRLTKGMTEMKHEHWTKRWNWNSCTNLALNGIGWSRVQIPLMPTFYNHV